MGGNKSEISNLRIAQQSTEQITDIYKKVKEQTGLTCEALEQICTYNDNCEELYRQLEKQFKDLKPKDKTNA